MGYSPEIIHFETESDLDPELKKVSEHGPRCVGINHAGWWPKWLITSIRKTNCC